ncbi:MAG: NAD(P)-binding domain-containing protein, partial [Acidobacteria bacterium]|nr:NAD(P)-binding domain-containing protein [Acidobacteriota bacterium]
MFSFRKNVEAVLSSATGDLRRPLVGRGNESNVKGLHIIGDLAGAPVIKLAMAQGVEVVDYLATLPEIQSRTPNPDIVDILVVGAGAAGLNAALAAKDRGLSCLVLEKEKIANTIENFPEGKWVYAEPEDKPAKGKLWLDGARKEDLVARWHGIVRDNELDVRTEEPLEELTKQAGGLFVAKTPRNTYRARKVVLATGQRGNPRKLGVPGEDLERVYHRLYSPRKYKGRKILVVGGGNSAVEAALTLAQDNQVVLSYRGGEFHRLFADNRRMLDQAIAERRIEVLLNSNVKEFRAGETVLSLDHGGHQEGRTQPTDYAFVQIGAELPVRFLKSLGIKLENEWDGVPLRAVLLTLATFLGLWLVGGGVSGVPAWLGGLVAGGCFAGLVTFGFRGDRWSWLGVAFFLSYSVYGVKYGRGVEFWP